MGKIIKIKGYQSIFGVIKSSTTIDGEAFLPIGGDFLRGFIREEGSITDPSYQCWGYISYRLRHLLGPEFYDSRIFESKEVSKYGNQNPFLYVNFKFSHINYAEINNYLLGILKHFIIEVEISYASVRFISEKSFSYDDILKINTNHGCGIFSSPLALKEHHEKIINDYPDLSSFESLVRIGIPDSFNRNSNYPPDKVICFLKPTDSNDIYDISYKTSRYFRLIKKRLANMKIVLDLTGKSVNLFFSDRTGEKVRLFITDKTEIIEKLSDGKLINSKNLDGKGIVMLSRNDDDIKGLFTSPDHIYSYSVNDDESEIVDWLNKHLD